MKGQVNKKKVYKVKNWGTYNKQLKKRGFLPICIAEDAIEKWLSEAKKIKGGNKFYSNLSIEVCLSLRQIFNFPLRQTEGFIEKFFDRMKVSLPIPDYTTLSRRASSLKIKLNRLKLTPNSTILIDSTGLKIYEGGDWAERKRGYGRHKKWRKMHITIAPDTQMIEGCILTDNDVHDADMVKDLLKGKDNCKKLIGDRAYDKFKAYDFLDSMGIKPVIPPQKNAVINDRDGPSYKARNKAVLSIKDKNEFEKWKKANNYSTRALIETTMFRYKRAFGEQLSSRKLENQKTEVLLNCLILNKMLALGKPLSYKVA